MYLGTIVLFAFLLSACSSSNQGHGSSSGSWAEGKGITFQHVLYAGTNEKVEKVEKKLGSILKFSKNEQDDIPGTDNFSNYYPKGTNLYKIPNVDVSKAIGVEVGKNKYIKAVRFINKNQQTPFS
jgi:hypothetical protein